MSVLARLPKPPRSYRRLKGRGKGDPRTTVDYAVDVGIVTRLEIHEDRQTDRFVAVSILKAEVNRMKFDRYIAALKALHPAGGKHA